MANLFKNHYWTHRPGVDVRAYHDPRIPIADHIGWNKPTITRDTEWSGLEPDNYNCAVLTTRPLDIPFLDESVTYRHNNYWTTIFRVDEAELQSVVNYVKDKDYLAIWRNPRATDIRAKIVFYDK